MRVAKLYKDNTDQITNLHYSNDGMNIISSSADDQIIIYDCEKGAQKFSLNSKKYGVDLIHFTQNKNHAVHASTKENDIIRYMSLKEDKYIRLWDLRSNHCQGLMKLAGRPVAAFDPDGLIFAAGINSESVKLYDLRSFDKGPFSSFKLQADSKEIEWTGLKFSPDGKSILISTNGSVIKLIDSYNGTNLQTFTGHLNSKQLPLEASFSPDSQFVISGSSDGRIHIWNSENGQKVCVLNGDHRSPVQCVQFNPKYMMMASACQVMSFWLPTIEDEV